MTHRFITFAVAVLFLVSVNSVVHSGDALPRPPHDMQGVREASPFMGDSKRGEDLYNASCIVCHGSRAEGGVGPKLAGNPVLANDRQFWKIVHEGRHVMPPLKGTVTDQQLNDIRAWIRTLP